MQEGILSRVRGNGAGNGTPTLESMYNTKAMTSTLQYMSKGLEYNNIFGKITLA